jgi:RNA polymerase sporulation-specific sigma factor
MTNELLLTFEPLIKSIALKFYNVEYDDLIQVGRIGLMNAYKNYDKNSKTKFSTYAYKYIFGEMYNYTLGIHTIKQSRDELKLVKLIDKAKNYLTQKLGKIPTITDIAIYLEMDEKNLMNAISNTQTVLSLDQEEEENVNLYNEVKVEPNYDLKIDLKDSLNTLTKDEQQIIKCRYFEALTQQETAHILKMNQVKVSRYEQKSLIKMRNYINCA